MLNIKYVSCEEVIYMLEACMHMAIQSCGMQNAMPSSESSMAYGP